MGVTPDAMLASQLRRRNAGVMFFEDCDELIFREATLTQWKRLLAEPSELGGRQFTLWRETVVSGHRRSRLGLRECNLQKVDRQRRTLSLAHD
jgi:hypothetical protein